MPPAGGDVDERTRPQVDRPIPLERQPRRSCQEQHPLVSLLVVPEALGRGVAEGDDPLDAEARRGEERLEEFPRQVGGDPVEEVREAGHGHLRRGIRLKVT
jgi:hypothetical protein